MTNPTDRMVYLICPPAEAYLDPRSWRAECERRRDAATREDERQAWERAMAKAEGLIETADALARAFPQPPPFEELSGAEE
jgi:hypothetical protein